MSKLNLLFIYYSTPLSLLTVLDNVKNFQLLSRHTIHLLNCYPHVKIPSQINLADFDGIIIDSTLAYFPQTLNELDDTLCTKLQDYQGIKVLLKQDEHVRSHETARVIGQKKIDLVFTCLEESQIPKVYPKHLTGNAQFVQQLTGYVSQNLISLANSIDYTRSIDLSYRGSMQPLQCGRLGYEKWQIGQAVKNKIASSFKANISSEWADRIYGKDWLKFLSCSKSVLGVESGSNLFDFTGKVEQKCLVFEQKNAPLREDLDAYYHKAHKKFLCHYEDNVNYAQISPRHFEAAATRTLQILYEGNYSGIFIPYKHYLPLKRDLSNLDEILAVAVNARLRNEVTDCAYDEIVMNEKYHYSTKIDFFDSLVETLGSKKNVSSSPKALPRNRPNIVMLVPHETHLDPRINWMKEGFDSFADTLIVGTTSSGQDYVKWEKINENTIEANANYSGLLDIKTEYDQALFEDYHDLVHLLKNLCDNTSIHFPDTSFYPVEAKERFQWYCNYFNRTDKALRLVTEEIIRSNNQLPNLLVCCDLSSLLPGVLLSQKYQIPLVYDAHEFWAYSDVTRLPWEIDFWLYFEKILIKYVDFPVTVSVGLAQQMSAIYGKEFSYLPNVDMRKNGLHVEKEPFKMDLLFDDCEDLPNLEQDSYVKFLYMGAYALGRGLEQLIDIWNHVDENNILILRGVYWEYTDSLIARAKQYGLYNKTVFFFKPVSETNLISSASAFDVGIIPYDPYTNVAYKYCCPNKLSQYMAAGLPILANDLIEVEMCIRKANCGLAVSFMQQKETLHAIHQLSKSPLLRKQMGKASKDYFLQEYNWDKQSEALNSKLKILLNEPNKNQHFKKLDLLKVSEVFEIPKIEAEIVVEETESKEITFLLDPQLEIYGFAKLYYQISKFLVTRKLKLFNPLLRKIKMYFEY